MWLHIAWTYANNPDRRHKQTLGAWCLSVWSKETAIIDEFLLYLWMTQQVYNLHILYKHNGASEGASWFCPWKWYIGKLQVSLTPYMLSWIKMASVMWILQCVNCSIRACIFKKTIPVFNLMTIYARSNERLYMQVYVHTIGWFEPQNSVIMFIFYILNHAIFKYSIQFKLMCTLLAFDNLQLSMS